MFKNQKLHYICSPCVEFFSYITLHSKEEGGTRFGGDPMGGVSVRDNSHRIHSKFSRIRKKKNQLTIEM